MLSNHIQSMFEYLAAPRRGVGGGHGPGGVGGQGGQNNPGGHGPTNPGRQGQNEGYKDMVY